jgi:hypothetical protein
VHIHVNRAASNIMNLVEVLRFGKVFKLKLTGGFETLVIIWKEMWENVQCLNYLYVKLVDSLHEQYQIMEEWQQEVDCVWNAMTHAQKPDLVFRRNGRVHLNRRGRQFSRLLAAEVCASAVVMLDAPCSEIVWRALATHSIRQFPLKFPSRASPCAIIFQLDSTAEQSATWFGRGWEGSLVDSLTVLRCYTLYMYKLHQDMISVFVPESA